MTLIQSPCESTDIEYRRPQTSIKQVRYLLIECHAIVSIFSPLCRFTMSVTSVDSIVALLRHHQKIQELGNPLVQNTDRHHESFVQKLNK